MKKTFLLYILTLCSLVLFAQNVDWLWATKAGGTYEETVCSIAVDANGSSYVTGRFEENTTFGTTTLTCSGYEDIFVAKMDSNGNWLWAKQAGGTSYNSGFSITIDANGNSYVTGYFQSSATFGTTTLTSIGGRDIFVAKLDSNGNWLWAKQAGGTSYNSGFSIAVDATGISYVTGYFNDSVTFGTITLTSISGTDIFVAKLDSNGNWLWANQAGGTSIDEGYSITVDASGNSYITGYFYSSSITFGTITLSNSNSVYADIFVAKLDSNGNWLWAKQVGGTGEDEGNSIAVDSNGNSYVTGYFFSRSITFDTTALTNSGYDDIFVAKLDSSGNWLWAKQAGGIGADVGNGIAIDANGNSYVTGYFEYSATFGATTLTSIGGYDIFVAKLDSNGNWVWAKQAGGILTDEGHSIAVDTNGNSYVTGSFAGSAIFGPTTLTSSVGGDIFVAKLGEANSINLPDIISFNGIRSIYPNPFNPLTTIDYEISMPTDVKIEVYNNRGQLVRSFALGYKEQGSYKLTWEGEDNNGCLCSSGIYYIRMQAGKEIYTKKAVLLK